MEFLFGNTDSVISDVSVAEEKKAKMMGTKSYKDEKQLKKMSYVTAILSLLSVAPTTGLYLWKYIGFFNGQIEEEVNIVNLDITLELMYVCFGFNGMIVFASLLLFYAIKMKNCVCMVPWMVVSILDGVAHLSFVILLITDLYQVNVQRDMCDNLIIANFVVKSCIMVFSMIVIVYEYKTVFERQSEENRLQVDREAPPSYQTNPSYLPEIIHSLDEPAIRKPVNENNIRPQLPNNPGIDVSKLWVYEVLFHRDLNTGGIPKINLKDVPNSGPRDAEVASLPATDYSTDVEYIRPPMINQPMPVYSGNMYKYLQQQLKSVK